MEAGNQQNDSVTGTKEESNGDELCEKRVNDGTRKTKTDLKQNSQTNENNKSPSKEKSKKGKKGISPEKDAGVKKINADKNLMETPKKPISESLSQKKFVSRKKPTGSASKAKSSEPTAEQPDSSEGWSTDDDDESLDSSLERKARKINMSVKNVKSLIHYVLCDEQVKRMFEAALGKESTEEESAPAAVPVPAPVTPKKADSKGSKEENELNYVPKLTRAKMKDWMEKGNIPLSPAKQPKPGSSILDVEFGEEEDDDEYSPDKDECNETDDESIVSSQMSEFGSPCPRTPGTPVPLRIVEDPSLNLSPSIWNKSLEFETSKGQTLATQENEGTIALRTRSKLPLKDTSLVDIEEAFVAPDITADLYDTNYDDEEWAHFLSTLYKTTGDDSIADDEANDPEFNYIAEAENEQLDDEDFRFDKPTKISKKELNTLIEELHSLFDEDEVLPYQVVAGVSAPPPALQNPSSSLSYPMTSAPGTSKRSCQNLQPSFPQPLPTEVNFQAGQAGTTWPQFKTPHMPPWQDAPVAIPSQTAMNIADNPEPVSTIVSTHQRDLIRDNMRKHVQLLAQTFLLTHKDPKTETMAETARNLLIELGNLKQSSPLGRHSVISVCNLDPALSAVNAFTVSCSPAVKNQKYHEQKLIVFGSPAFLYPHLLPTFTFSTKTKKDRQSYRNNKFLPSENNLIALGLEQFADCQGVYPEELIHKLLIRGKTVNQIYHHVRFLSSTMASINPVKKFRRLNQAVELEPPMLHPIDFRAPQEKPMADLPNWCREIAKLSGASIIRSQGNLPQHSSSHPVFQPIKTTAVSSTASSVHSVIQTPVLTYSGNDAVRNLFPQTETVTGLSTLVSPVLSQNLEYCRPVTQSTQYCKILPFNPSPEEINSCQSKEKQSIKEDIMSSKNDSRESPVNMEESSHLTSPPQITSSPKSADTASPMSITKSVSFYDSPSVYAKVASPSAVSTPNAFKSDRPPSVRNLGPEFDSYDGIPEPEVAELKDLESSTVESTLNVSSQRTSRIDPDLLLPHSPLKKVSKGLQSHTTGQAALAEEASSVAMPLPKRDAKHDIMPLASSKSDKSKKTSSLNMIGEEGSVSKKGPSSLKVAKSGKTQTLTVISKPSKDDTKAKDKNEHSESQSEKKIAAKAESRPSSKENVAEIKSFESETNSRSNSEEENPCGSTEQTLEKNSSVTNLEDNSLEGRDQMEVDSEDKNSAANKSSSEQNVTTSQSPTIVITAQSCLASPTHSPPKLVGSPIKASVTLLALPKGLQTPKKLTPIAPKESSSSKSPVYVPLPKVSPRRKKLNRQIRQILPKSIILDPKCVSPTKAAAMVLKKKAICQQRSPVKILPRPAETSPASRQPTSRNLGRVSRVSARLQQRRASSSAVTSQPVAKTGAKAPKEKGERNADAPKEVEESEVSEVEESAGTTPDEGEDKQDQINLDDLMAACTTIGFSSKTSNADEDVKGKTKKQRELALLQPDLVESDPKKDERDTAFAQCYFDQVKKTLEDDPQRFRKFLELLKDMNKNPRSPVELYADIVSLLSDHQQLVEDFAGFLLSFQALECQCFISNQQIAQIRRFLRQIEVHCGSSASVFQKVLRVLSSWLDMYKEEDLPNLCVREKITGILKNIPGVLDDLICYFLDGPLPDCQGDEFEEVDLLEDPEIIDEFEEVVLPHERESYNTKKCSCQCHSDAEDERLQRRLKHCVSCSLKMYDGYPVLNMSKGQFRPIRVVYPLEEKEKLAKAKRVAAHIALAKARALRQNKGRKDKPIRKVQPQKKHRGKLKGTPHRRVPFTLPKKRPSLPQLLKKRANDTSSKGAKTSKIQFEGRITEGLTPFDKDAVVENVNSEESACVGSDERQSATANIRNKTDNDASNTSGIVTTPLTDLTSTSDKMIIKMPFENTKCSTAPRKDAIPQKSSIRQGHQVSAPSSSRKRQSSQRSPNAESLHSPPAKRHASLVTCASVGHEESNTSEDSEQDVLQLEHASVPAQEESSSQVESQAISERQEGASAELRTDTSAISETNEEFDRCVLNNMSYEGITEEGVQAILELMPGRTVEEIHERAVKLLEMLENMSESTTDREDD